MVGYPNIHPRLSFAAKPDKWFRTEGEVVLLWAGWDEGVGNHWFRLNHGELDHARISEPLGRDVIPAIDEPWVETADGQVWRRIPAQAPVVGQSLEGLPCVYPYAGPSQGRRGQRSRQRPSLPRGLQLQPATRESRLHLRLPGHGAPACAGNHGIFLERTTPSSTIGPPRVSGSKRVNLSPRSAASRRETDSRSSPAPPRRLERLEEKNPRSRLLIGAKDRAAKPRSPPKDCRAR